MARDEAREAILQAAIVCLSRQGVARLTVRAVAAEAGVNVAAISYYFGGKAALVEAALERTLEVGSDLSELDEAIERTGDLRGALEWFLLDYLTHMQEYPGLIEAHLHEALSGGPFPRAVQERIGRFTRGFAERAAPLLPDLAEGQRVQAVVQLWSALLYPGLLPGYFRDAGVDVAQPAARAAYVHSLVERFLGEGARGGAS